MGKATARIAAGICGFETIVQAETTDAEGNTQIHLYITSQCDLVQQMAKYLSKPLSIEDVVTPYGQNVVISLVSRCRLHSCCPVPCALLKAAEVAANLALPADVHIEIRSQSQKASPEDSMQGQNLPAQGETKPSPEKVK